MFHLIYLAAGYSRRFGSNKLLYPVGGRPMYRHLLDRLTGIAESDSFRADLTVVTQYAEIADSVSGGPARAVLNEDPSRGISSSLQTGIGFLQRTGALKDEDYLVFFTADQPYLTRETVEGFLNAVELHRPPPCAFQAAWVPDLMALSGDRGGRQILRRHPEDVLLFETDSPGELADVDRL